MNKFFKKIAAVLALTMVFAALPMNVFALTQGVTGAGTETDPYVVTPETAQEFINSDDAHDAVVKLSAGDYGVLEFKSATTTHNNLTLVGETGTMVEGVYVTVHQHEAPKNLTVKNITFDGTGVGSNNIEIEGWKIVDCKFTGNSQVSLRDVLVKNITVENCEFTYEDTAAANINAIIFNQVEGFTVTNCKFTNVPYNAIQVNNSVEGSVVITGNNFDTKNRVIKLAGYTAGKNATFDISGNYFADPSAVSTKTDGNYIEAGAPITIGSNTYETDPTNNMGLYFINVTLPQASSPETPAETTHEHVWGYNAQFDAAAHWDYCHVCGAQNTPEAHSDADGNGVCDCGWVLTSAPSRVNPNTGVTAEMLK